MTRFALYLACISAGLAAWTAYRQRTSPNRRIPVREAAAKLQQAWADHHTTA